MTTTIHSRWKNDWPLWLTFGLVLSLLVAKTSTQDTYHGTRDASRLPWEGPRDSHRSTHHPNHNRHHRDSVDRTTARSSWYEVSGLRGSSGRRQDAAAAAAASSSFQQYPYDYSRQRSPPYHQPLLQQESPPPVPPAPPPQHQPSSRRSSSGGARPGVRSSGTYTSDHSRSRSSGSSFSSSSSSSSSSASASSSSFQSRASSSQRWRPYNQGHPVHSPWADIHVAHRPATPRRDKRPNIVLIISDDQDVELGSLNYMPRLMNIMRDAGAYFPQAYTSTPMCCPSRSSMLTGMYIHNHEVYTNNDNCSSTLWQQTHERRTFATYLNDAGYRTGYFGKYLNKYNGSHVPVGWREWAGLIMNSKYYNYTVNRNNQWKKYGDQYPRDYYPHVITNDGVHFLETSKRMDPSPPVMMVLSYPAPHGPEDSAPEHAHRFFNATDHHTMAYDYAPNPDKQWILQFTGRMHDIQLKFTDVLMTKRLQTLQTLDESVQRIVNTLESLGELGNTYIFYTSDHGYHLGQFGLVKGKSMPFEFDIKVPFLVRGPGIRPGTQINNIALNVDLAPTFLDIAGIKPPPHMDGRSLLPLLKATASGQEKSKDWRDTFLVESSGRIREEDALELRKERQEQRALGLAGGEGGLFTSKHERLELVCESDKYRSPCSPLQTWECVHDGLRWRLKKCRVKSKWRRRNCVCEPDLGMGFLVKLDSEERRKQRLFLKKHVTQDLKKYDPKFLKAFSDVDSSEVAEETLGRVQRNSRWFHGSQRRKNRHRRSSIMDAPTFDDDVVYDGIEEEEEAEEDDDTSIAKDEVDAFVSEEEMRAIDDKITTLADELQGLETVSSTSATVAPGNQSVPDHSTFGSDPVHLEHGCRATETSVDCTDEVYLDPHAWKVSKAAIDDQIRRLRHQLFVLKDVRKHLRNTRPDSIGSEGDYDYEDNHEDYSDLDVRRILDENRSMPSTEGSGYVDKQQEHKQFDEHIEPVPHNVSVHMIEESVVNTESPFVGEYDRDSSEGMDYEDSTETTPITMEMDSFGGIVPGEDIIIGRDYDLGIRGHKDRNYIHGRKRPKSKKDKFDIFRDTPHKNRNKNRNKKNGRKHDENETALELDGVKPSLVEDPTQRGHLEPASQFEFYPSRGSLPSHGQSSPIADNETTPKQPICWCDKRMATKLAIQQERAKKRAERQKLKLERLKRKEQKMRRKLRKSKDNLAECSQMFSKLNCYQHDNDHWKTPPLWHDGKFCFCMNAPNNTYWCLRTINDTHNFLYCEFITGLVTYYDLNIDPYQLRNVAFTLSNSRLAELHHRLEKLRVCVGADQCDDLPNAQSTGTERQEKVPVQDIINNHAVLNNVVLPVRRLTKAERMQEREERRRLRKLSKKYRKNQLYGSKSRQVLDAVGSGEHKVRLPRKSRMDKERRRERQKERRDRRRKKKSRRNRKLRQD
ncbi:extracellular sulfatase Sulf-1 isoform X4 [Macrobrachium rosenbergii]|uniref:extracellular sulfatase Sulf-1 isoform X4 n=1 Tax=Macrobrachium rosenbergii TaxID=79674 RepID=UPI0034D69599